MSKWNPVQYEKFLKDRTRPAIDLACRLSARSPKRILDLARQAGNDVRFSVCPWELLYTRNGRDKPDIKSKV